MSVNGVLCAGKKLIHRAWGTLLTQEDQLTRYAYECQLLTKLHHPNVVKSVGLWYPHSSHSIPILVMEKFEYSLFELLCESEFTLPLPLKVSIMEDIANGLLYLHTRFPPIIHRDLKVLTIHLTSSFLAKICSLGSACTVIEQAEHDHPLLRLGGAYSPGSVAPEATASNIQCDISMDVFSFGHMALCLIIGKLVWEYNITLYS